MSKSLVVMGLVLGCLMFLSSAQAEVLLYDDFESGAIDSTVWGTSYGGSLTVVDSAIGYGVVFNDKPYLYTLAQFKPTDYVGGIMIEGEFTFDAGPEGDFDVTTRCDKVRNGYSSPYYGMPNNGVYSEFYLHTNYSRTRTRSGASTTANDHVYYYPADFDYAGNTIGFTICDDGSTVTGTLVDPDGDTHEFTFSETLEFDLNHVLFCGDRGNSGTRLEWVRITAVPEPSTLALLLGAGLMGLVCLARRARN